MQLATPLTEHLLPLSEAAAHRGETGATAGNAAELLRDGQRVTVDGTAAVVEVLG
jgi:hypothetical protein